jgi:dTDP-4-amino-4,6-dideoxygalactose transaminase
MQIRPGTEWNYSYYPVIFESESQLLEVVAALHAAEVTPRRYFYPSLNTINYTQGAAMPVSESVAARILCLPLYVGLDAADTANISDIINTCLKHSAQKIAPALMP